ETILRINEINNFKNLYVLTNAEHKFLIKQHLHEINLTNPNLICEPLSRNTAPAAALAAFDLIKKDPEAIMLLLPADHYIANKDQFLKLINLASEYAFQDKIVTFGMHPTSPEIGYGYIEQGEMTDSENNIYKIKQFVEKPNLEKAKSYIANGNYSWNSGIFIVKAKIYLEELKKYRPDIFSVCFETLNNSSINDNEIVINPEFFANSPNDSIDYAIMEHTDKGYVIRDYIGWTDIGSWDMVWSLNEKDKENNVCIGDIISKDCENSYIFSQTQSLLAVVGIRDLIVIKTGNATLIMPKSRAQDVKNLVNYIEDQKREEVNIDTLVPRPWGKYEVYADDPQFKVKRIIVKPGQKLSLQSHKHRSEHWVVVQGIATVTVENKVFKLKSNQSTYINAEELHRLENKHHEELHIIEVQTGTYFGEDDIVRYDDDYGRAKKS
ncbi:Mannose-1-phosphate guanylyltransferase/mannose-6-phosphate isomerase, partial [Reticulomyxa filosa]